MPKLEGSTGGGIVATLLANKLLILIVLIAILIILLVIAVVVMRKKGQPAAAASAAPPAPAPAPAVDTELLHSAWLRFLYGLPGPYRRSILNFEQFVVMGGPASGKTRVIDTYSDWKHQTREFATSQANDPDLPLYLGSRELIMELPAAILDDDSETAFQTLNKVWRPVYKQKGPTVVAVVDVARLMQSQPHQITDLAQKMRGKINLLTEVRGRAIEVRVVLTHLDELEGYEALSEFCRDHEIPLQVQPPTTAEQGAIGRGFDAWFDDLRGYIPNALVGLESPKFRGLVTFMAKADGISGVVRPFLRALFQHEAVVAEPIYGGVYLAAAESGAANPLQYALETGPGPDPKRGHLVAASAIGIIGAGFFGDRYLVQHARWSQAHDALQKYSVVDKPAEEPFLRADIINFTAKDHGWLDRHSPDFFDHARREMRRRFSDHIRTWYFIKRFKQITEQGTIRRDGVPMAGRRAIYYLGLIHSDKTDKLKILEPGRPELWATMLELHRDVSFLSDYLNNVDTPFKTPIADLQLVDGGIDPNDGSKDWVQLFDEVERALADGRIDKAELGALQKKSKQLRPRLDRFDNDWIMRGVLPRIDAAAGSESRIDGEPQKPGPLETEYGSKLDGFMKNVAWTEDPNQLKTLRRVLDLVNAAALDVTIPKTLGELVFRLEQIYGPEAADIPLDSQFSSLTIDGVERRLPTGKWAGIIRDSKAKEIVEGFLKNGMDENTLLGPGAATLAPVRWNPGGDGAAVFVGHGSLDGKYTKVAYDTNIRDVVGKLTDVMTRANLPEDLRVALNLVVGDQIVKYAGKYRDEGVKFTQSFDVQASSQEALRVALAQMSADTSAFQDFLVALDQNTRLQASVPLLAPIKNEMMNFDAWHATVAGAGGAPEIGKYKAILAQILSDLQAAGGVPEVTPGAAGLAGAPAGDTGTETLEKLLTAAGKLYLAELRGEKGSYSVLVENWLTSIRMPEAQRKAFRAPLKRLAELGRRDIERVINRMWQVDMLPALQRVATRFPFDRSTTVEVTPDEMKELFHPKDGRVFDLFKRYVEPVSQISGAGGFRPMPSVAQNLSLPPGLYTAINASAALSSRLWDQGSGNPKPIELKISTVRFDRRAQPKEGEPGRTNVLTLMYLNIGDNSVFNFNQQPSLVTVGFDWTKDHRSQVGIQLTDNVTKETAFPSPLVSRGTYWSIYHLLLRAKPGAVRYPAIAQLYTWEVWAQPEIGAGEMIPVRYVMVNNPWEPFAGIGHFAPRHRELSKEAHRERDDRPAPPAPPRGTM